MTNTFLSPPDDILCIADSKWNSGHQRPQQLVNRFARRRRVFFVEEPVYSRDSAPGVTTSVCASTGVQIVTASLPAQCLPCGGRLIAEMLSGFAVIHGIRRPIIWTSAPAALDWMPPGLAPAAVVYDCASEAPPQLQANEERLIQSADIVLIAQYPLFQSKRYLHSKIYFVPNGIDVQHFSPARSEQEEPSDQRDIARPRLGFAGSLEAIDLELIRVIAEFLPEWQIVMLSPHDSLALPNLHWLGSKDYNDLPRYFSGWNVAIMPFPQNKIVRDRNPVSTPEYLAAGLPVVSTPIVDVMQPYGDLGLVSIASQVEDFVGEVEHAMLCGMSLKWRERAERFLQTRSWDDTWNDVNRLVESVLESKYIPLQTLLPGPALSPAKPVMH